MQANFVAGTLLDHPSELVSYEDPQSGWIIAQEFIGRYRWICEFVSYSFGVMRLVNI